MKFTPTDPQPELHNLRRELSDTGRCELRLDAVLFGVRVRFGLVDSSYYSCDYCAGANPKWQMFLLYVVKRIVERQPESADPAVFHRLLLNQIHKPMMRDAELWRHLCRTAGVSGEAAELALTFSNDGPALAETLLPELVGNRGASS